MTWIGLVAGFLTTISFVPQVWTIWKTRETAGVSLLTFTIFSIGVSLWLAYGIVIKDPALIATNIITLVLSLSVVGLKLRYRKV